MTEGTKKLEDGHVEKPDDKVRQKQGDQASENAERLLSEIKKKDKDATEIRERLNRL